MEKAEDFGHDLIDLARNLGVEIEPGEHVPVREPPATPPAQMH